MAQRKSPGSTTTQRGNLTALPDARPDAGSGSAPDTPPDASGLTARQQRVLGYLKESIEKRGYPPSIREIGEQVGLASSSSVAYQLRELEAKGFIRRDPNRPRAVEVFIPELMAARRAISAADPDESVDPTGLGDSFAPPVQVKLLGRIAAGAPILAEEHVQEVMPLPQTLVGDGTLFMLEVSGDSMIDVAICDGDYVVVRQEQTARDGQIVAALTEDGGATVKTLQHRDGHVLLLPHNPDTEKYQPIDGDRATILGIVTAVLRKV